MTEKPNYSAHFILYPVFLINVSFLRHSKVPSYFFHLPYCEHLLTPYTLQYYNKNFKEHDL